MLRDDAVINYCAEGGGPHGDDRNVLAPELRLRSVSRLTKSPIDTTECVHRQCGFQCVVLLAFLQSILIPSVLLACAHVVVATSVLWKVRLR